MNHVFRLVYGDDLLLKIDEYVKTNNIKAGVILCAVGCVNEISIRLANGKTNLHKKKSYEIISLIGSVSINGSHLHIALADEDGLVIGGHLNGGCLINTTCEICLLELEDYEFNRTYDIQTGYQELLINKTK
ncbi:MAG: DNA-binding protein [Bacilli bacterium]|jgi:predicted DNA-binding protein with PD1-like motif|nr:DNA-binding protein [Bacilli bacterium]